MDDRDESRAANAVRAERRRANLGRLFNARHIAFVGGRNVLYPLSHCQRSGFAGDVWLVNPKERELNGIRCFPSVEDLPAPPDATFVGVPREPTLEVVASLARAGAGAAVCYAAGFSEIGPTGDALQQRLAAVAGDVAVLGPNCNGIVNHVTGGHLWPTPGVGARVERGVALITQSGGLSVQILMSGRGVDFAYAASVGNQAMLGVEDCIGALADDPHVSAFAVYLEGLRDVEAFSSAALAALARDKPVIVVKAGKSEVGSGISLSHTSSIAGSRALYQALFDRLGVISVDSCTELLEVAKLFTVSRPPAGRRLVIFTCSGGSSNLGADRADELGLELPTLSAEQSASLKAQLPFFAAVSNPLDYNTSLWGKEQELRGVFATAMRTGVDAGVLQIDFTPPDFGTCEAEHAVTRALVHAQQSTGIPAYVISILPELLPPQARAALAAQGVPPLQGLADGMKAIAVAVEYAQARRRLLESRPEALAPLPPLPADATLLTLDEWDGKQLLAGFGLAVPRGTLCSGADDAARAAAAIGFPVVVKVVSAAIAHKTELGAVKVGLHDAAAVHAAVDDMSLAVGERLGRAPGRFLVEAMVDRPVAELIVGVVRHEGFGLALVFGAGGVLVELLRDSCTLLLPVGRDDVGRALRGLKVFRLLEGYRGQAAGDVEAAVDAIMAIAAFAQAHRDRLVELDVNPLLVGRQGLGATAVDAVVRFQG